MNGLRFAHQAVHTAAEFRESRPPVARFSAAHDPSVGTTVRLDATGSSDPDGHEIVAWTPATANSSTGTTSTFSGRLDGRAGHGASADAGYRIEDELRYPVATG